jgi:translocator protein
MKPNYILIPLIVLATAFIGGQLTTATSDWYRTLPKPTWTPPGSVIGTVWTIIFILSAIAALIVWNTAARGGNFTWIVGLLIANAFLNVLWSFLFFQAHLIGLATVESALLCLSVVALIILTWPLSRIAASLFIPYAAWTAFATYLVGNVWSMNR